MKVDLDSLIYDLNGEPIKLSVPDKEDLDFLNKNGFYKSIGTKDQTLKDYVMAGLNFVDKEQSLEQSMKQVSLIRKVFKGGEVELKAEEIAEIKKLCGKVGVTPLVLSQIDDLLEGKDNFLKP